MSHMPSVLLQKSGVELRAFLQTLFMRLHRLLCSSQSMPIYKVSMEESRWGAVCPGTFLQVLMIRVKCSLFEEARQRRALLNALAALRSRSRISQSAIAKRIKTSQPAIARLEAGTVDPRLSTLQRYAASVGKRIEWTLVDA